MNFISNGDYNFPFDVHYYWLKLVYIWSYQTGSANPDGIIRMPGRIIDLIAFVLTDNIFISLFYILTCFGIVFLSFYCFSRFFLKNKNVLVSIVAALFFTINPIFLGNASKIGLVLAAAMLPLCLVVIQKAFEKQQIRYLLLWVACLNISLIHPFTFTVNLLVSGGYLLYMAYKNKPFITKNIPKIILVGIVALLLNAYFLLPLANIGTINKDVLSSNVDATPTDYTSLIEVANTGDIFTGLSLAKGVLKDYEFFNESYQLFYFIGIFSFYVILFGVYVRVEKKLSISDKKYFAWSLAAFLLLILLAAVNYLFVKDLIKLIVGLPGGWIFRSPLKWQLYVPFAMATMLAITLAYVAKKSHRRALYLGLAISFILMNGFIGADVYHKLLAPRTIDTFAALQQTNLDQKSLLIVNDDRCLSFATMHPRVMTELNQVLISKNVQVKQMSLSVADTVNLSSYDYILGCQDIMPPTLKGYDFNQKQSFADNAFQLYENVKPKLFVYANQKVFAFEESQQIGNKYDLVTNTLQSDFDFINTPASSSATTYGLQDAYENVTFEDLSGSSVKTSLSPPKNSGKQSIYLKNSDEDLYFNLSDDQLSLTPTPTQEYQLLSPDNVSKVFGITHENKLDVSYDDAKYDSINIFPNPSLEQGLWRDQVGDCYAYGGKAEINMRGNKEDKTDGAQSLQLEAQSHVACSGPDGIPVQAEQNYLLGFDYKSVNGRFAAYHVSFDDEAHTSFFKRLKDTKGEWGSVAKNIEVPPGARTMKVLVYAYPDTANIGTGVARYDNFQLTATPKLQNKFYLLSEPKQVLQQPKEVNYKVINPTKTEIHIKGAQSAFYLETKESYSPRWNLGLDDPNAKSWWPFGHQASVSEENHIKVNNFMNGWLVDPSKLCQSSCTQNSDGSYDLTLVMEFTPQRWLYIGGAISTITLLAVVGYLAYDKIRILAGKKYLRRRDR